MSIDANIRPLHPFERQTVAGLLETRAALSPDATFLVWAPFEGPGKRWTYRAFADDVARVAGGFARLGVTRGDHVVLLLENCPEAVLAFFACAWLGAVCVPVNAASTAAELAYFVERTQAVALVTQPKLIDVARAAAAARPVIVASDAGGEPQGAAEIAFASLLREAVPRAHVDTLAAACVLFTSGTTARPKGVVWTQANVLWAAKIGALQEGLRGDDVHLVFLPLFHVVGLAWSILPTLWAGGSAVLQPKFSASRFWDAAIAHGCTWASMVPFCTAVLAKHPVPQHHRFRMWGHAVFSSDYERRFGVALLGWWGMTEMVSQGVVGEPGFPQVPGSIGRPSAAYNVVVRDDTGRAVAPGESGELRIRGTRGVSLFLEYLGDPDATRAAFDEDGYFRTGDRVTLRDDGTLQFVDRLKDVIKVGGESVAAPEVERVIAAVPGVQEVAVVAKGDRELGEVPIAFVRADASSRSAQDLASAVLNACRRELAKFKVPRDVILVDDFPRVAIGKIAKARLRSRLAGSDGPGDAARHAERSATGAR